MGNRYMKADQSINDLCSKNHDSRHRRYTKRPSKSTEDIPARTYLDKSHRFRFLSRSCRKRSQRPVITRPTTTERIQRQSTVESGENNLDPQNLGFAIFKDDSFELAKVKYCHKICTSTPKLRRFNALEEFEKLFEMNLNGYGSDISSISRTSLFFNEDYPEPIDDNVVFVPESSRKSRTDNNDCNKTKFIKNPKPLPRSLLGIFEDRKASTNPRDIEPKEGPLETKVSGSSLLNIVKPHPKQINIIIIGDKGVGKTTLIHSLLQSKEDNIVLPPTISPINIYKASIIKPRRQLNVTVVDTPGLDIETDGKNGAKIVEEFLQKCVSTEKKVLHCCLFCVSPFHVCLRPCDIELMKRLENLVNIVPVIVKVDYLTIGEAQALKKSVKESLRNNQVRIYQMPRSTEALSRECRFYNDNIKKIVPFAIIGSRQLLNTNDGLIRGRKYPWGIINIDNPMHCDMYWLRKFLFESHCADLVYSTRLQLVRRAEVMTGKTCTM